MDKLYNLHGNIFLNLTPIGKTLNEIIVPSEITILNSSAFKNCSNLTKIVLPENLEKIGDYVFKNCSGLTSLIIPKSVKSIGKLAFDGCDNLNEIFYEGTLSDWLKLNLKKPTNSNKFVKHIYIKYENGEFLEPIDITIPDDISELKPWAFYGFNSLVKVTISKSVNFSYFSVFANCKNLKNVIFEEGSELVSTGESMFENCQSLRSVTFEKNAKIQQISAYTFKNCKKLISVTFSEGSQVKIIGYSAFNGCENLEVDFLSHIEEIHCWAFDYCLGIKNLFIPATLSNLSAGAFCNCYNLEKVTFDENCPITKIGDLAFKNCTKLKTITFPKNLVEIYRSAFEYCSSLEDINLPKTLEIIDKCAFAGCTSLEKVEIPKNVLIIYSGAFSGCHGIKNVSFEADSKLTVIEDYVFSGTKISSIVIPKNVIILGYFYEGELSNAGTFENCKSLKRVEFENPHGWYQLDDNLFVHVYKSKPISEDEIHNSELMTIYVTERCLIKRGVWYPAMYGKEDPEYHDNTDDIDLTDSRVQEFLAHY